MSLCGQQDRRPQMFSGAPWKFPTFWYSPRPIEARRAETNLVLSSPLSEFTFFLVLVALHVVVTVHGSVVQDWDSSVSHSLPLQDLLLL